MTANRIVGEALVQEGVCECGAKCQVTYSETLQRGRYEVRRSRTCLACERAEEAELAQLPQEVRDDMLAQHGIWVLIVPSEQRVRALAKIRGELGISFADVAARRSQAGALASGTLVEMTRLRLLLGEGLDGAVHRLNDTG